MMNNHYFLTLIILLNQSNLLFAQVNKLKSIVNPFNLLESKMILDANKHIPYHYFYRGKNNFRTNTAFGIFTLKSNDSGRYNTAGGFQSLADNTTGNYNTSWGYYGLRSNTTGYANSAFGAQALFKNIAGYYNLAVGVEALKENTTGFQNTALGGYDALHWNTSGSNHTAIGCYALYSNTTGDASTGIGWSALYKNTTGTGLTALGNSAGADNLTGNFNTYIGYMTGKGIKSGNNNTIIGSRISGLDEHMSNHIIIADGEGNQRIIIDSLGNMKIDGLRGQGNRNIIADTNGFLRTEEGARISRIQVADVDFKIDTTNHLIAFTSLTGRRSIVLPALALINQIFIIKDEAGLAEKYPISIAVDGGQIKIDGKKNIILSTNYGVIRLYYNGKNYFTM